MTSGDDEQGPAGADVPHPLLVDLYELTMVDAYPRERMARSPIRTLIPSRYPLGSAASPSSSTPAMVLG